LPQFSHPVLGAFGRSGTERWSVLAVSWKHSHFLALDRELRESWSRLRSENQKPQHPQHSAKYNCGHIGNSLAILSWASSVMVHRSLLSSLVLYRRDCWLTASGDAIGAPPLRNRSTNRNSCELIASTDSRG